MHKQINSLMFFEYLSLAFVQKAILAGFIFALLAGTVGSFVTIRRAAFWGDAIAHSALAGIAIGLFFKMPPLLIAFIYAMIVSVLLPYVKSKTEFEFDTLLGILLSFSMALGVIIFSLLPGYQTNLMSYLFGNVLTVSWVDVISLLVLLIILQIVLFVVRDKLLLISFDNDYAQLLGVKVYKYETIYHFMLAITIISGVHLMGIVLMSALLIIPSSIAQLYVRSMKAYFILTPIIGVIIVIVGILLSIILNTPSGAMIALVAGLGFILSLGLRHLFS